MKKYRKVTNKDKLPSLPPQFKVRYVSIEKVEGGYDAVWAEDKDKRYMILRDETVSEHPIHIYSSYKK